MSDDSRKVAVALLSFAHVHARGYADAVRDNPAAEIAVVWDENGDRGGAEAERVGAEFCGDLDTVLGRSDIDAVVVNAPTDRHRDIIIAAAQAGKHIFTEKALTITTSDATDVVREVEEAKIKFMISLPSRTRPEILFAKRVVDEGRLGSVTLVRARIAHSAALDHWFKDGSAWFGDEAQAGGGALFDLGCHRVDVVRWLLGPPASVSTQSLNYSGSYDIDDNMVAAVQFHNRALAILDASWVHKHGPNPLEIYGTEGYLGIDVSPVGPRIQFISDREPAGATTGCIVPGNLPAALPSPMQQWISSITDDTVPTISVHDGWNLTQLLEGCYTAARQGHEFTF